MQTTTQPPLARIVANYEQRQKGSFVPSSAFYKDLGINQKRYGQLLRGEVSPTVDEVKALAMQFGVTATEFLAND